MSNEMNQAIIAKLAAAKGKIATTKFVEATASLFAEEEKVTVARLVELAVDFTIEMRTSNSTIKVLGEWVCGIELSVHEAACAAWTAANEAAFIEQAQAYMNSDKFTNTMEKLQDGDM